MSVNKKMKDIPEGYCVKIDKGQLNSLPAESFHGKIHIVDTIEEAQKAVRTLSSFQSIGFDTETRPSFKKGIYYPTSLVQLSTMTDAYLFRLNKIGFTSELKSLLENQNILKIGVSLKDDQNNLSRYGDWNPAGMVDMQSEMSKYHIADTALSKIYAIVFDKRISKGQRLSNWEIEELTPAQQQYAALDAQAPLILYNYLSQGKFEPSDSKYLVRIELPDTLSTKLIEEK